MSMTQESERAKYPHVVEGVEYPMRKVTLGSIDEYVPLVGIIANGGMTSTLADVGWQHDEIARMLADGHRIIREWWVAVCADGCGRLLTVDDPEELPVCRECGIADMEAKYGTCDEVPA